MKPLPEIKTCITQLCQPQPAIMASILDQFKEKLSQALQGRPEIIFAMLYGSAIEGGEFNDLDIGLWVERLTVPPLADLSYAFDLADELGQVVAYPVDVRIINQAPLPFRYNVSRGQALLVNDEAALLHFLERTWDEFLDFKPVAMQYIRELGTHLKELSADCTDYTD